MDNTCIASSPGHSQILSRSHGEKSGEGMCFLCFFILSACIHVLIQDPGKRETHSWHAWNGVGTSVCRPTNLQITRLYVLASSPGHSQILSRAAMEKNREKAWDQNYVTDKKWWTWFVTHASVSCMSICVQALSMKKQRKHILWKRVMTQES